MFSIVLARLLAQRWESFFVNLDQFFNLFCEEGLIVFPQVEECVNPVGVPDNLFSDTLDFID